MKSELRHALNVLEAALEPSTLHTAAVDQGIVAAYLFVEEANLPRRTLKHLFGPPNGWDAKFGRELVAVIQAAARP